MHSLELYVLLSICLLGSLVGTYLIIPKIIKVVSFKKLMDNPNHRSSHTEKTPSLGGIAFYIAFVIGMYFLKNVDNQSTASVIGPGLLVLFIIGLKDDLSAVKPITKLIAQIIAVSFVVYDSEFIIRSFHGFLGITELSPYVSIPLAGILMLYIINAFNLIDGIDGLASMVGIVIFSIYGVLYAMIGELFYLGLCLIAIGSLISFLRYNVSSDRKIFMGDTGSMVLGFMVAIMTIHMFSIEVEAAKALPFNLENLPLIVLAILIVPFFDTTRVFTLRLMQGRGPFSPDRNHIHHLLIDYLKLSHRRASFLVSTTNLLFIFIFLFLGVNFSNFTLLIAMIVFAGLFTLFFFQIDFSFKGLRKKIMLRKRLKLFKNYVLSTFFNF